MSNFQGQDIMKESVQALIDFVFQTLKFKKILAITDYKNHNSTKLLLKFNFVNSIKRNKENPNLIIFTLIE
jgi:ribosomal-protein-alanine N-acetyltransferase